MRSCAGIAIRRNVFRGDVNTLVELFMGYKVDIVFMC
jgi:hypothetical protein